MSHFDRGGKGLTNERRYPYVVELGVSPDGMYVELSRRIINFHESLRDEQNYYRWCFSDLATAHAFIEHFGGAFRETISLGVKRT
jgi:hypothetical protein